MTADQKITAFDLLTAALTQRWADGLWSWWCGTPCGGGKVATQGEAVADLLRWAWREAARKAKAGGRPDAPPADQCGAGI